MKTSELKACPICGKPPMCQTAERASNGELYQLAGVWCKPCRIDAYGSTDEDATRKWNDRAGRKPEAVQNAGTQAGSFQREVRGTANNNHKIKTGIERIAEERARQISTEGWTPEHDDTHQEAQMARAAATYAIEAFSKASKIKVRRPLGLWPWGDEWWKPAADPIRNLEKAGALIAAEIDRLQRASNSVISDGVAKPKDINALD